MYVIYFACSMSRGEVVILSRALTNHVNCCDMLVVLELFPTKYCDHVRMN